MKNTVYRSIKVCMAIESVIERAYRLNTNQGDSDSLKAIKVLNVLKSKRNDKTGLVKRLYIDACNQMQSAYNQSFGN